MDIVVSLASPELKQSELQRFTRSLCNSLQKAPGMEADILEVEGGFGKKGDVITAGTIALSLISSGGVVVTLINVLKSYFDRAPSMEITLEKEGKKITVKSNNLHGEALEQTIEQVQEVFGAM